MRYQSFKKQTGFIMAAMTAMTALAFTFGPGIAEAGGYKHKYHGKHYGSHYGKHYKHKYKHHSGVAIVLGTLGAIGWPIHSNGYKTNDHYVSYSRRHYRRHKRHSWKHAYNHGSSYGSNNYGGYQSVCHTVKKRGYWHGHKAKIGGTACVDEYGNFYVVKGSRYLIKYLY